MTTATFSGSLESDHDRASRARVPVAVASFATAAVLSVYGAHDMTEWVVEVGIEIVATVVIFGVVVPRGLRHASAGGRGIVMAVIGLLLVVPAFWSGLPILLGSAAALLGHAGKRAPSGAGRSTAALVLGLLVVVAYLTFYLLDYLHTHGIG